MEFSGCASCAKPYGGGRSTRKGRMTARRQQQKVETMKEHRQAEPRAQPYPAARLSAEQGPLCPGARLESNRQKAGVFLPRTVQTVAAVMIMIGVIDTVKYPVAHIVEEVGGIDWMNEVEVPTEEYYEAFDLT